jgi:transcriptional regulator
MTLYIPQHFRLEDRDAMLQLMRENAFAVLVSTGDAGLHVSHIPFVVDSEGTEVRLLGHLARANEQWRALEAARDVVAIFQGPHAYVSPGWYQQQPSVPTWNYAVVHAHGTVEVMEEAQLHELLMTLSSTYEAARDKPWKMSELPAPYVSGMLQHIVGFTLRVERLEAKFKLSQNRPAEIPHVVAALEAEGEDATAALMRIHALTAKA